MQDLSINDPNNIAGMSFLVNTSDMNRKFNPQQIEEEIINGVKNVNRPIDNNNEDISIEKEISAFINYDFKEPDPLIPFKGAIRPAKQHTDSRNMESDIDALYRDTIGSVQRPRQSESNKQKHIQFNSFIDTQEYSADDHDDGDSNDSHDEDDDDGMTNEEKKQNVVNSVFDDEDGDDEVTETISRDQNEEEKSILIEEIISIKSALEKEGVQLPNYQSPSMMLSIKELRNQRRIYNLINDRRRCETLGVEFAILGARAVAKVFDGKRSFMGKKPDLTGWDKSVQQKLRRMKHDTSSVVGNAINGTGIGPGTRILLELLPSAFLHSSMKDEMNKKRNNIPDKELNDDINKLRDFDRKKRD